MAKALMGSFTTPRVVELLDEVRALRARVAQLEEALSAAETAERERATQGPHIDIVLDTPETVSA